ncbi:class II fructose-bisphosphate aldolase [Patescibacteria group bacterium]|nr:class II fructose-bisphosphate aldolase [Patescibacteria group bacterium]MBU4162156.1 class II fructose-bisphosphate aldolase [Patescibacteria group bacterium]
MSSKNNSLKYFLQKAHKEKWAIGQFNFSSIVQFNGIVKAAMKKNVPVILGTSESEADFLGIEGIRKFMDNFRKPYPNLFLHLDHGKSINIIKTAIQYGYDSVHFDGSGLKFEENIKQTRKVVEYAHRKGVLVEGEIKSIKGSSETHKKSFKAKESFYEDIEKAKKFVKATGIDSLAINIGNVHGTYRNKIRLNIDLLKKINKEIKVFLVLHGGSGTDENDIKKAIKNGIVKININTELRIVWKQALQKELKKKTIKPYEVYPKVIEAVQKKVEEKIKLFK